MANLHCSFMLVLKGLEYGTIRHLHCKFLMVTHGILAHQYTPQVRGNMSGRHLASPSWRLGLLCCQGYDGEALCISTMVQSTTLYGPGLLL